MSAIILISLIYPLIIYFSTFLFLNLNYSFLEKDCKEERAWIQGGMYNSIRKQTEYYFCFLLIDLIIYVIYLINIIHVQVSRETTPKLEKTVAGRKESVSRVRIDCVLYFWIIRITNTKIDFIYKLLHFRSKKLRRRVVAVRLPRLKKRYERCYTIYNNIKFRK